MSPELAQVLRLVGAAALAGMGMMMVLRPTRWRPERSKARERALAERLERGHDRYFEELRALQAYPSSPSPRTIRVLGLVIAILAAGQFFLILAS